MKKIYKALDYFRNCLRHDSRCPALVKMDNKYWLLDGYVVVAIAESDMELNPSLFRSFDSKLADIIEKAESGENLKLVNVFERLNNGVIIPLKGETGITWISKKYLDLFPDHCTFKGTSPSLYLPIVVQEYGTTIGVICPIRHKDDDDISLFLK
jgi:hypothetical protein